MPIGSLADVEAQWNGRKLQEEIERAAGRGVQAAAIFLVARLKEVLSVPAAQRIKGSRSKYRIPRATPGAPPRKRTGRLRAGQGYEMIEPTKARVGTNVFYAPYLEYGNHPYLLKTAERFADALGTIAAGGSA